MSIQTEKEITDANIVIQLNTELNEFWAHFSFVSLVSHLDAFKPSSLPSSERFGGTITTTAPSSTIIKYNNGSVVKGKYEHCKTDELLLIYKNGKMSLEKWSIQCLNMKQEKVGTTSTVSTVKSENGSNKRKADEGKITKQKIKWCWFMCFIVVIHIEFNILILLFRH